jgi:crotonobetainyl-CoA:carnitine CoA-transferase CaiB-like acyl-CoA transferase
MEHLPLSGIRVLDLSRVLAGPLCTMLLGDLGADVIKVERPGSGDETRGWGPPFDDRGESAYYLSINRNKLSIAADFARESDRMVILGLMREADVVVENFLPGALAGLGIDADAELQRNPRLVWCGITGFGADTRRPGYDFVVQAESGWMAITGEPDGSPMKTGVALADVVAGKDATIGVMAALIARDRKGAQRRILISLMDSARAALLNVAQNALASGKDAKRWGNAHANLVPYQLFEASDRDIVIAVGNDAQWTACASAIGVSQLADDPALATNSGRLARRDFVVGQLAAAVKKRPSGHWVESLQRAGVPCGVVKGVLEVVAEVEASAVTGMPSSIGGIARITPPRLDEQGALIRESGWGAFSGYR